NTKKPTRDEFEKNMMFRDLSIISSTVSNSNVSHDGKTAIVSISYTLRTRTGDIEYTDIPLKLYRERGCWKIPYSFVTSRLLAGS
ncbi:MAG TPA: hypothetical protein PLZ84_09585, partial [Clostridia bacterium]|nr:hypothetical protein [Clostridia bacterium]